MARKQSTGVLKLWYVPSISNTAAPTATEINAGTNLTAFLRRNGLKRPQKGTLVDSSDVSSKFNAMGAGSYGGDAVSMTFYRDSTTGSDTAWTTLARGTAGYFVVAPFGGTPASSDRVEVWPIEVATREMDDIDNDKYETFTITVAVTSAPNDSAAVA